MDSTRTLALAAALLAISTGAWLWKAGHLDSLARALASSGEAVAADATAQAADAAAGGGEPDSVIKPPAHIVSWTDADGVLHYSTPDQAPPEALRHELGKAGTLADYEKALQEESGIDAEALYRAQQARLARENAAAAAESAAAGTAGEDSTHLAVKQAQELLQNRDAALEQIRQENAR